MIYDQKKYVSFIIVKPLETSNFKMNLFLDWPIQNKWMKNCEKVIASKYTSVKWIYGNTVDYKVKQNSWKWWFCTGISWEVLRGV